MALPKSDEIFDYLSKGRFISANAVDADIRHYYGIIENHFEELKALYAQVGFSLEAGNNYYFLAKQQEARQTMETKLKKAYHWLDVMAFFTTFNQGFTRGVRFTPHDILKQAELNVELKDQLEAFMKKYQVDNYQKTLEKLLKEMSDEGFVELENSFSQTYKVLDAYQYLEQLVQAVTASEEGDNE